MHSTSCSINNMVVNTVDWVKIMISRLQLWKMLIRQIYIIVCGLKIDIVVVVVVRYISSENMLQCDWLRDPTPSTAYYWFISLSWWCTWSFYKLYFSLRLCDSDVVVSFLIFINANLHLWILTQCEYYSEFNIQKSDFSKLRTYSSQMDSEPLFRLCSRKKSANKATRNARRDQWTSKSCRIFCPNYHTDRAT